MSSGFDFEVWFLLAYTGYVVGSVLALMWIGRDGPQNSHSRPSALGDRK